ncbi:hypothetical protein SAMN04489844_0356 [Nocardioides exalbidus]|uniref:Uncharacterized protein n=1 Tax=Nocardioides exalbidus TaxID=402596 RepID=A0A1H4JY68_9ACTN|nr:hypothetical protein [Nocardioides exalbidus]SEB51234.1 hypothetical protein SAMN04489844_0356 [Nocardioides exalbidus]
MRALLVPVALVVGAVSGAAGTLLHQHWWGLGLALVTGLVVLAWAPPGALRVAFALGWCVPVLRGALERPAGGFLISSDAQGWSFIAGSFVLLVAALATVMSGRGDGPGRAGDPGLHA